MRAHELFEAAPRTLYHGTLKELLPEIKQHGLVPTVGEFVSHFYDPSGDEGYDPEMDSLEPLVFAASKVDIKRCVNAIVHRLRAKNINPTPENIIEYGAIIVIKDENEDFYHRPRDIDDESNWQEYPTQVEPGDYYSHQEAIPAFIVTGKRLKHLLRRNRIEGFVSQARNSITESWWHGSPSGELVGSAYGLHLGTEEAARQALEARIGIRADGKDWDGTQEYGKTLLAGRATQERLAALGRSTGTGYNSGSPEDDHYPTGHARYGDGTVVPMTARPSLKKYKLVGPMSNSAYSPMDDFKANGHMKGQLKKGNAKRGYYYRNEGEDAGSISVVVPSHQHVEEL